MTRDATGHTDGSRGDLPGLDLAALRRHLDEHAPDVLPGELTASLIAGGKSNLTYVVTGAHEGSERSLVLRRPPLGHVLATAHDMGREYRVMSALADTAVPVPTTYLLVEDDAVLGAPFYLMERAAGTPYRSAAELSPLGPDRTRAIGMRLLDILGLLHAVDPAAVGLADFGHPDGFCERQVRRWGQQLERSRSRDLAGADELHARLSQDIPSGQAGAIVHGDYRLDNLLVDSHVDPSGDATDTVTAVLDWEMATLGDPLTDVGLLVVYNELATLLRGGGGGLVLDVSRADGYPTMPEQLGAYVAASGRDLSRLSWYVALGYYKLAVILEGIHYRHTKGQTVGAGFATIGEYVEPLLAGGLTALKER
ncbi:MAG: phosphotransferase family protein [Austwickia sp.]|jgi:aminoglycoside phosphotransferase (APT) family kinase protein|nr:MAG: phosphotransferase family protein [Austwickia sp.]